MNISLWQAFSSNHSAPFTLVGVFNSPAEAEAAAERLGTLLADIRAWRGEQDQSEDWEPAPPTPPEQAAAEALGIDWGYYSLDWVPADDDAYSPVTTVGAVLFIDGSESAIGAQPLDAWVARLGGQPLVNGERGPEETPETPSSVVRLRLSGVASDEATAQSIETDLRDTWQQSLRSAGYDSGSTAEGNEATEKFLLMADDGTTVSGDLHRAGRQLTFEAVECSGLADGLALLLAHLQARGCAEIEYAFSEVQLGEEG